MTYWVPINSWTLSQFKVNLLAGWFSGPGGLYMEKDWISRSMWLKPKSILQHRFCYCAVAFWNFRKFHNLQRLCLEDGWAGCCVLSVKIKKSCSRVESKLIRTQTERKGQTQKVGESLHQAASHRQRVNFSYHIICLIFDYPKQNRLQFTTVHCCVQKTSVAI